MSRRIMFAGGGTGGHLFPAFALAEEFTRRLGTDCEIRFFVTGRELEVRLIGARGYRQHRIHVRGIKRGSIVGNLMFPVILMLGLVEAMAHILRFNPDLVIGTGGYLAYPAVMAAKIANRAAFLQEQNSYPGIAARKLARFADRIFIAYEQTAAQLGFVEKCILTGNPVRAEFGRMMPDEGCAEFGLDPEKQTVLVFGGSQGAASINDKIMDSLPQFASWTDRQLIWQVGRNEKYLEAFKQSGVMGTALPFIENMPAAYAAADLVVCRAGALTLSELTACGRPAILIPYPHATEDHQTRNAQALVEVGAAKLVADASLNETDLAGMIAELISDETQLMTMSLAAGALAAPHAAENIVQRIFEYMDWR